MTTATTLQLLVLFILLLCSSFFSASETALMSLSKIRLRHMVEEEVKHAALIERLLNQPSKVLGAILIGNNIVNIGASSLATSLAIEYFGNAGIGIATGIMTFLVLIFGEITPKTLAAENAEKVSLATVQTINFMTKFFRPVLFIVLKLTRFLVKLLGGEGAIERPFISEDELKMMVTVGHEEGILEIEEKKMIHNVFEFGDAQVKSIMTPRMDMEAVDVTSSYNDLVQRFKDSQFSRLPVYQNNMDDIIGSVYLKDFFFYNGDLENFDISQLLRKPFYTYEFKRIAELFSELKKKRIPMAIVLDEYGGTAGIVTIEDLVEEIVGELNDEYDDAGKDIELLKDNEYLVRGITRIDDVNEILKMQLPDDEFDTIGGYVIGQLGRMPKVGDVLIANDITIKVLTIDKNRIVLLNIRL